jgi:hypothetical protein
VVKHKDGNKLGKRKHRTTNDLPDERGKLAEGSHYASGVTYDDLKMKEWAAEHVAQRVRTASQIAEGVTGPKTMIGHSASISVGSVPAW